MCFDQQRLMLTSDLTHSGLRSVLMERLRVQLVESEAQLSRARAREAVLTRQLKEMKRFISVMQIVKTFLKQRSRERHSKSVRRSSLVSKKTFLVRKTNTERARSSSSIP